jgi:hypothetical protein
MVNLLKISLTEQGQEQLSVIFLNITHKKEVMQFKLK